MNRVYLKERGKVAFKRNYWLCVLVALILAVITGALATTSFSNSVGNRTRKTDDYRYEARIKESANIDETMSENALVLDVAAPRVDPNNLFRTSVITTIVFITIFVILIASAVGIAVSTFVTNVLEIGARKFFLENTNEPVKIDALGFGFKKEHYMNIVKVSFMKNLYIFLWSLLFIIPGIIKSFEYYYVSYLLSEDPNMDYKKALEISKQMTDGHKWDIFVLELSFIGWHILGGLTFNMVDIFWTNPYQYATEAELYLYAKNDYSEFVEVKKEVKQEKEEKIKEAKVETKEVKTQPKKKTTAKKSTSAKKTTTTKKTTTKKTSNKKNS